MRTRKETTNCRSIKLSIACAVDEKAWVWFCVKKADVNGRCSHLI